MKLGYTILYVENVEETVAFYEKAFGLKKKFVHEAGDYGELDTGSTTLSFASFKLAEMNEIGFNKSSRSKKPTDMEIAFVSTEVEASFKRAVSAGALEVKKPVQKPWGQLVGYVRDNNGFLIEICSPMG